MKKKYFLSLTVLTVLIFFAITAISAETDGIFDIWYNPQTGQTIFVSQYNHDNSVFKGPEYQEKIIELMEKGYLYKGYGVSEYSGGSGPTHGSYEENYFVKTILSMSGYSDQFLIWRSTPEGVEYSEDGITWNIWDGSLDLELPTELEELDLNGIFQREAYLYVWVGPRWYNWGWRWTDIGEEDQSPTSFTLNPEGTEGTWVIDDYWMEYPNWVHAQITVDGEEVWDTRTVVYELPPTPAGAPQLLPKHYGVQVLGTLYGPKSLDEIPPELLKFAKEINGQWYTYSGSELEMWIFENIYKSNHAKSYVED